MTAVRSSHGGDRRTNLRFIEGSKYYSCPVKLVESTSIGTIQRVLKLPIHRT